ncbi:hypothetical protein AALO_G00158230 [Alosa alosa]|uniref:C2H2-type domain-containing protein n=2 Tax=Alosa alosa TaxID=278164 RepID=A0AAV6GFP5_9TELE|nr:teashirt homolog 3-like isoform X1 [Alosa alosa]KAG5274013.1 hypothetical protein AALO_G00158230 [Alosa alosa]
MPRRKQQAPKRAAAYSPEDTPEQTAEGGEVLDNEDPAADHRLQMDSSCPRSGPLTPGPESDQDACLTDLSSHDLDSESHLSEPSDRMSDFGDSVKNEEVASRGSRKRRPGTEGSGSISPSSLEQMKAIYSSFLTNSYWSSLGLRQPSSESMPCPNNSPANPSSATTSSSGSTSAFDWHQSAMAKTLQQQALPSPLPLVIQDPGLVSTIHLQRQSTKLYGSIFTGASKFRCKGCSLAFETLVELTVHMNETGHYRDDNHSKDGSGAKSWSKPRKRSLLEMEGKDDAQKVLRCMYCGHSFESLQDLSVHMIKTKHYQKVPLKEPMPSVPAKMVAQSRKRLPVDLDFLIPQSKERPPKVSCVSKNHQEKLPDAGAVVTNNHHGNQNNGSGGTWQFESHKSQILKCMECGTSHDSLQELTAHMVVTGHFINVNNIAMKKSEVAPLSGPTSPTEEKSQTVPLPPSSLSCSPASLSSPCMSPSSLNTGLKQEDSDSKHSPLLSSEDQKVEKSSKYNYLTEEDLKESPKVGADILKSLENTVSSAIHKAQTGSPSWGGYQSIHAAYQLPSSASPFQVIPGRSSGLRCPAVSRESLSLGKSQGLTSPASSHSPASPACQSLTSEANKSTSSSLVPPSCHPVNLQAMQELVKRVTEKMAKVEKQMRPVEADAVLVIKESPTPDSGQSLESADQSPHKELQPIAALEQTGSEQPSDTESNVAEERSETEPESQMTDLVKSPRPALDASTAIITNHSVPEQPFVNPLSALQSVMNLHLGKVAKPAMREADPMSMLFKMSNSMADKVAVATPLPANSKKTELCVESFQEVDKDQPIDLSKGKSDRPRCLTASSTTSATLRATTYPPVLPSQPPTNTPIDRPLPMSEAFQESALADISDMVRNLTQSHVVTKATKHSGRLERTSSERTVATPGDAEEDVPSHRRKGRQSNWNVQHLLILQAQFTASLRRSAEGKYVPPDLSLKERTHISHITGLSMTTISHWLANVKYQLRRSGRTKFLKNLDSGQPAFFCSQCSTQIQTPSAYVEHLESHLGFRLKDLAKVSGEKAAQQLRKQAVWSSKAPADKQAASHLPSLYEEGKCVLLGCKFCKQTFTSKHALRLHTCQIHGRTEDLPPKGLKMET